MVTTVLRNTVGNKQYNSVFQRNTERDLPVMTNIKIHFNEKYYIHWDALVLVEDNPYQFLAQIPSNTRDLSLIPRWRQKVSIKYTTS